MTKHYYTKGLDIPQDADSVRYFIPEGYTTARLEDGVLIIEPKESEDEKINRAIFKALSKKDAREVLLEEGIEVSDALSYLEKHKTESQELYYDKKLENAAKEFYLSGGADSPFDSTGLLPIVKMAEFGAEWQKKKTEKEQKPVKENKEETIIEELISYFKTELELIEDSENYQLIGDTKRWLSYLEKQKERKPELPKPHKGDDTNPYDMSVSEAQEYAINRGFGIPFNDGEVYVDERYITQTIGNILRWADEHPKEQKPVHTAKEMWKEMRLEVYAQASGNRHEPNYSDDSTKMFSLCDIDEIFEKIGDSTIGSQSPEWGEDDDRPFNNVLNGLKYAYEDLINHKSHDSAKDVKEAYDWMVSRFRYFCLKQEWGEEDKKIVETICKEGDLKPSEQRWLKSLPERFNIQPQQEWSDEDELMRTAVIQTLETFKGRGTTGMQIDWMKSLRPQSHWKPSEEQMRQLGYVAEQNKHNMLGQELMTLYNDLKKLL